MESSVNPTPCKRKTAVFTGGCRVLRGGAGLVTDVRQERKPLVNVLKVCQIQIHISAAHV
jgi:hypothetical protein